MTQASPFAAFDENLSKYLTNFFILLREERTRAEEQLPNYELIDYLAGLRSQDLPLKWYQQTIESQKLNMKYAMHAMYTNIYGLLNPRQAKDSDGKDFLDFRHLGKNIVRKVYYDEKEYEKTMLKTILYTNQQKETGVSDIVRLRVIVESEKAQEFLRIRWELSGKEQARFQSMFRKKFSVKALDSLNAEQVELYKREFKCVEREYEELGAAEKQIYQDKFAETHRQICLEEITKIALNKQWKTVPHKPHAMVYNEDGIELKLRAQVQKITNSNLEEIAVIEDFLFKDVKQAVQFIEGKRKEVEEPQEKCLSDFLQYSKEDKLFFMQQDGEVVYNIIFDKAKYSQSTLRKLAATIKKRHATNLIPKPEPDTLEGQDRIMESLKLQMDDLEERLMVYPQSYTAELQQNHRELTLDYTKSVHMFIDECLGKHMKNNKFEQAQGYVTFGPWDKQIVVEFQVRSPEMHETAEHGSASHGDYDGEKYGKITPLESSLFLAFLSSTAQGKQFFQQYYLEKIMERLEKLRQNVFTKEPYGRKEDEVELAKSLEGLVNLYELAEKNLPKPTAEKVLKGFNNLNLEYLKRKGLDCVNYYNSAIKLGDMAKELNETAGQIFFKEIAPETLGKIAEVAKLDFLYKAFKEALDSQAKIGPGAAICLGQLIEDYKDYRAKQYLSDRTIRIYKNRVWSEIKKKAEEKSWKKSLVIPFGYLPAENTKDLRKCCSASRIMDFLTGEKRKIKIPPSILTPLGLFADSLEEKISKVKLAA
ncbi:MAG: hypothetical protein V1837_05105 [Candidatus Woesearchaeota archaeon]